MSSNPTVGDESALYSEGLARLSLEAAIELERSILSSEGDLPEGRQLS